MEKERGWKEIFLDIAGLFLFATGLIAIIYSLAVGRTYQVLWFCYIALVLSGLGIFFRNIFLIVGQLNISFLPLIFWNIDFFHEFLTRRPLWGVTSYFFVEGFANTSRFISLQHVYFLPLVIFCIYLIAKNGKRRLKKEKDHKRLKNAWKLSLLEAVILFVFGRLLTPIDVNMNCVFESCIPLGIFATIPYELFWFLMIFLTVGVTNLILFWLLKKYTKDL